MGKISRAKRNKGNKIIAFRRGFFLPVISHAVCGCVRWCNLQCMRWYLILVK